VVSKAEWSVQMAKADKFTMEAEFMGFFYELMFCIRGGGFFMGTLK